MCHLWMLITLNGHLALPRGVKVASIRREVFVNIGCLLLVLTYREKRVVKRRILRY